MEDIYNVFLFFKNEICSSVGYRVHPHSGSDEEGLAFLQQALSEDFERAIILELTKPFTLDEYHANARLGQGHALFDEMFVAMNASAAPLFISTPVVNGKISIDYSSEHSFIDINAANAKMGIEGIMDDWLVKYTDEKGIRLSELIHDDYFLAIKLTFNAGLAVSAMKLLVSCIDSLAYIEYGNKSGCFVAWLDAYCDLKPLGITAEELWELRNGILHMTNLNSKKVAKNHVRRISFRIGGPPDYPRNKADGIFYFDFQACQSARNFDPSLE